MREKLKRLLGGLLGSGILILIVVAVFGLIALVGGNLMVLFGFSYKSTGSLLLYFLTGTLIGLPLEMLITGLSRALYQLGWTNRWQANLLYIPLDTIAKFFFVLAGGSMDGQCVSQRPGSVDIGTADGSDDASSQKRNVCEVEDRFEQRGAELCFGCFVLE